MLFTQLVRMPAYFALAKAGRSSDARIAMTAMTTSSSMSVKPEAARRESGESAKAVWSDGFIKIRQPEITFCWSHAVATRPGPCCLATDDRAYASPRRVDCKCAHPAAGVAPRGHRRKKRY